MTEFAPLHALEFETGAEPRASIILMHGLGADGGDFAPFVKEIDLHGAGPVRWVFPNAPHIPVTINGGYVMPAWFDINLDRSKEDEAGLRRSQAAIEGLIAREKARGVAASRIVLAGFSQGCAMALLTGLRYPERLAGIVGMSGYLPLASRLAEERSSANAEVPLFLAHGRQDEMIVLSRAQASRDALQSLGYGVEWHEYDMPHSVCADEVEDLNHWLLKVLAPANA
ncbi:dienelactone hydrolase family protein [Ottowia caeni]|uniref:alpha/beta hydrolase n=1 Tax=Ottowia caeni TaxID=2870339 RepID=UPI001E2BAF38|nr:dienelactone hydrolase family protein [Ottowia caeni]